MGNCLAGSERQRRIQANAYTSNNVFQSKGCKVERCTESHNQHYCSVCHDGDSSHFARNCPNLVNTNNYASNKSPGKQKCKVNNCRQSHPKHFCSVCRDPDSSHFSTACPNVSNQKTAILKCKVDKCLQNHEKHYCRECNTEDSLHFSRECPNVPKPTQKQKCKADACSQDHSKHYCSVCKNQDSSHLASKCPSKDSKKLTRANSVSFRCKVKGCLDNHRQHFCNICQDKDSSHFASSCPNGIIVYHGTAQKFKEAIKKEGFKPSQTGRIGRGVYFTDDSDVAWQIAKDRAEKLNSEPIVFQALVPKDSFITEKGQHPTWHGVTQGPFKELKVNKQKQIKIIKTIEDSNL